MVGRMDDLVEKLTWELESEKEHSHQLFLYAQAADQQAEARGRTIMQMEAEALTEGDRKGWRAKVEALEKYQRHLEQKCKELDADYENERCKFLREETFHLEIRNLIHTNECNDEGGWFACWNSKVGEDFNAFFEERVSGHPSEIQAVEAFLLAVKEENRQLRRVREAARDLVANVRTLEGTGLYVELDVNDVYLLENALHLLEAED